MEDIYPALGRIIGDELGTGAVPLTAETVLDDLPGWDSVTLAGVMLAVEAAFGVPVGRDTVDGIRTAGDLARLCARGAG